MPGIFKRGLHGRGKRYFFMIIISAPETEGDLYIFRGINFVQFEVGIFCQDSHSILEHRQRKSASGHGRVNFSAEALCNQFGDSADMIHMSMGDKKYIYFLWIVWKRRPVHIVRKFYPLGEPAVK